MPTNLHFASPIAKQNEKHKKKSAFMGETITFSIWNKPFKPREGFPEMIPTNIVQLFYFQQYKNIKIMVLIHEQA
jgi:hypothetical protein